MTSAPIAFRGKTTYIFFIEMMKLRRAADEVKQLRRVLRQFEI
jgi:hypothetical protein